MQQLQQVPLSTERDALTRALLLRSQTLGRVKANHRAGSAG